MPRRSAGGLMFLGEESVLSTPTGGGDIRPEAIIFQARTPSLHLAKRLSFWPEEAKSISGQVKEDEEVKSMHFGPHRPPSPAEALTFFTFFHGLPSGEKK